MRISDLRNKILSSERDVRTELEKIQEMLQDVKLYVAYQQVLYPEFFEAMNVCRIHEYLRNVADQVTEAELMAKRLHTYVQMLKEAG